jgi:hypothetical protein
MKKAHWFPSVATVAFVTLYLSSIYGTLSTISLLKKWENCHTWTGHSQDDQQPHDSTKIKIRENTRAVTVTNSTNSTKRSKFDFDVALGSNDQRLLYPIIVQTLQTHFSRISLNTTIANNDHGNDVRVLNNTDILQREQRRVLETLINHYSTTSHRIYSDVVELRHCRLDAIDYSKFSRWAAVILIDAWPKVEGKLKKNANEVKGLSRNDGWDDSMYLEFCLGLLEMFATHSKGEGNASRAICDFEQYSLNIQRAADMRSAESILRSVPISSDGLPRLVCVIVAFQDADHLEALIEACFMPHHLIVVHLERRSPPSFTDSVHKIANKHTNVVVVQFGSIIYQTDSVSMVNYKIMHWLTEELKLSYDYLLTLGNAVYPLHSAEELTNYFQKTERDIWLGELRNNMNGGWISWGYLERKRLIFTAGDQKYTQRTKKWKQNGFDSPIPDYIKTNMTEKTNSGNQAVFSYNVVKKLIDSPQVRGLFSMAKYGCCCCLEERTWIAAARMIGHGREAMEAASVFQVWGGEQACGDGSMNNALLRPNATICYKSEDATKGNLFERQQRNSGDTAGGVENKNAYFRGDKLLEELRLAKERGYLFARKFKSGDQSSLELIEVIKKSIHNS